MSITDFLLARISEDEREANACLDQYRRGEGGSKRRWVRQLAECAAKRAIVAECETVQANPWDYADAIYTAEASVYALAAIYADHDEYQDEWRVRA